MYKAAVHLRFSKIDQANLDMKILEWKRESPNDDFFFRGYGQKVSDDVKGDACDEYAIDDDEEIKVCYKNDNYIFKPVAC